MGYSLSIFLRNAKGLTSTYFGDPGRGTQIIKSHSAVFRSKEIVHLTDQRSILSLRYDECFLNCQKDASRIVSHSLVVLQFFI